MAQLSSYDWLTIWESSLSLPEPLRACALLAPLLSGGMEAASSLPVGQRDAQLLDLYGALFGPRLQAVVSCAHCGEKLDLELTTTQLKVPASPHGGELELTTPDHRVRARLPNSSDLALAQRARDDVSARTSLLTSCVRATDSAGATVSVQELPSDVLQELADAMQDADPQAVTELALSCPSCRQEVVELFDIGKYFLQMLGFWAERALDEVHALAHAYGWSEREVLELSPARRARYLARVLS